MHLKDFISQAITELVQGVVEGHNNVYQYGARVNPHLRGMDMGKISPPTNFIPGIGNKESTFFVDFDIAIIASEDKSSKAGFGIFAGAFGVGASGNQGTGSSQHSRMKFSIPISLPEGWAKPLQPETEESNQ